MNYLSALHTLFLSKPFAVIFAINMVDIYRFYNQYKQVQVDLTHISLDHSSAGFEKCCYCVKLIPNYNLKL